MRVYFDDLNTSGDHVVTGNIIVIIIIGIHWTQDNILCVQIIIIQALLYNETSAVGLSKPCRVSLQKLEQWVLGHQT